MPVIVGLLIAIAVLFTAQHYMPIAWLRVVLKIALMLAVVAFGLMLPFVLFMEGDIFLPFIAIACIALAAVVYSRFKRRRAVVR